MIEANTTSSWALLHHYQCIRQYTDRLSKHLELWPPWAERPPRRGIVYAGGGRNQLYNILIGVHYIRRVLNCSLPIEVVYHGPAELHPVAAAQLRDPGLAPLELVDSSLAPYPPQHRPTNITGFAAKVYALYAATSFDEVLLMDADSYPLVDPAAMFELPEYKARGNLFFPDFWHKWKLTPEVWRMFGRPAPYELNTQHMCTESGQMLLDRRRHAAALEWIWYLNSHHAYVYSQMWGDKDSFLLAFYLAGQMDAFSQSPHHISLLVRASNHRTTQKRPYHFVAMVQYAFDGRPLFVHQQKWFPRVVGNSEYKWDSPQFISVPVSSKRFGMVRWRKKHGWDDELRIGALARNQVLALAGASCTAKLGAAAPPHVSRSRGEEELSMVDVMRGCGWAPCGRGPPTPIPLMPLNWFQRAKARVDALRATFERLKGPLLAAEAAHNATC